MPSNSKSRGSHINTNNGKNNIPQSTQNIKSSQKNNSDSGNAADIENGLKSKDDTIYDDDFEQAWWDSVAGTLET